MNSLENANRLDKYNTMCMNSPLNFLARKGNSYIPWIDQTISLQNQVEGEQIIVMHPSADGGMPHTRAPNIICIPAYYPENKLQSTLTHERVHLHQRKYPNLWERRLIIEGWKKIDESKIPIEVIHRVRLNPDTCWSRFWAWQGRYIPLPMFLREDKPNLREITIRWYDLVENITSSAIPPSFTQKYGNVDTNSMEHPFELWAYN